MEKKQPSIAQWRKSDASTLRKRCRCLERGDSTSDDEEEEKKGEKHFSGDDVKFLSECAGLEGVKCESKKEREGGTD